MRASPLLAPSLRLISAAFIALVLMLCVASIASAQTSSDDQYGSPTAPGEQAIENPGGAPPPEGAPAVGVALGVLPDTGGSFLVFLSLGVLSLGAVIMLVLRHARGGQG